MQITLIRHLPTEWNRKSLLQGRRDISIATPSVETMREIDMNNRHLAGISPFDLVLVSTLRRTHQTANLYGYKARTEELLSELDFGPYEGKPKKILLEEHSDQWVNNPKSLILGESLQNLEKRIILFTEKFREYKNLLVFGHGSWIRGFLSYQKYGDINQMNKIEVKNNECNTVTLNVTSPWS